MRDTQTSRPLIGVTGPTQGGWPAWFCSRALIWLAGGRAVRITPEQPHDIQGLSGLVIGGGADIHPSRYREQILHTIAKERRQAVHERRRWLLRFLFSIVIWLVRKLFSVTWAIAHKDVQRDDLEFHLLKEAVERQIPVLGICRGGQLINVHFGGTLYQDISSFYSEKPNLRTLRPRKTVVVEHGTTLYRILCRPETQVNSLHNQSVKELGAGLRIAAKEPNGVVQAIEHTHLPFVVGVQWHPEFLPLNHEQRRIFHHLVEAAKVYKLSQTVPPGA